LPSGMKLALLPKKTRGNAVKILLKINAGGEKDLKGIVEAVGGLPEMVQRGTKKHTYQELRDELDKLKAELRIGRRRRPGLVAAGGGDLHGDEGARERVGGVGAARRDGARAELSQGRVREAAQGAADAPGGQPAAAAGARVHDAVVEGEAVRQGRRAVSADD